ncbi:MAG: methyl-accepting chemotaxis protein [Pseudomonadota bacterium]
MAKHKGQSKFLGVAAILLPILLAAVAGIIWFSTTSGTDRGDTASLAAAVQANRALSGENAALDQLATIAGSGALEGPTASQASTVVSSAAAIRAVNAATADIDTAVNTVRQRIGTLGDRPVGIEQLSATIAAVDTGLAALRGAPETAVATSEQLVATAAGLTELAGALAGDSATLDVPVLADASTAGLIAENALTIAAATETLAQNAESFARAGAALGGLESAAPALAPAAAAGFPMQYIAPFMPWLPLGLLGVALLVVLALVVDYFKDGQLRRTAIEQADQNERNQQAILRLLDELGSLADGDLTVEATVTEDITGAIADSINYAIEALRELVTTIDGTAAMVDSATRQTETTAVHMNRAAQKQAMEIAAVTESIAAMTASIEEVSGNAERSSDVARHSVDVAHKGGDAVRRTIEGMNTIRETIQETSKRIKRLGESSQEIGNIVELINDIAEQTNILALNASIQASMAGEAGRGFAVVADEVQRLAERSTNATKQIEVLVRTIQADTNEAVVSMERSTTDVVGGALLAENAGAALDEIEQVSNQIASLVQNIYGSARSQSKVATDINRRTVALKDISGQTGKAAGATTTSISKLAQLAGELRKSVSGFRLPESASVTRIARASDDEAAGDDQRAAG